MEEGYRGKVCSFTFWQEFCIKSLPEKSTIKLNIEALRSTSLQELHQSGERYAKIFSDYKHWGKANR